MKEEEQFKLLKRIYDYARGYDKSMFQPLYIKPAEKLRQDADKLEQKEKDLKDFAELIPKLTKNL